MTINLDDLLYRYVVLSGIHTYKVIEIHTTKFGNQYVLEDQNCRHGWKCQLLCEPDNSGYLKFIRQLNDNEDDPQEHWHKAIDKEYFFKSDISDAYRDVLASNVKILKSDIEKLQQTLNKKEADLKKAEDAFKTAETVLAYFTKKG